MGKLELVDPPRQGLELGGVAPGERLRAQLGQRRNIWLQQVVEPHPQRREPPCVHYGVCGGCSLQHLSPQLQLQLKAERVYRLFAPDAPVLPACPSPQIFRYRTKVELSFIEHRDGRSTLGFMRRGCFDRGVEVQDCLIGPPCLPEAAARTRRWQAEHALRAWNPKTHQGDLRYLVLRQANPGQDWLGVLVTRPELNPQWIDDWSRRLIPLGPQGLLWIEQESSAGAVVPLREHLLWGENRLRQPLGPLTFELGWRSFFQIHPPAYLQMLQQLQQWIAPLQPTSLLDLYCGIGSIGLSCAPDEAQLVGVESVPEAIEDARRISRSLGRKARFEVARAEDWEDWNHPVVILDPPRSGCHPQLLERLQQNPPEHLFYISCNPDRLAAELSSLQSAYRLEALQAFDFFPQTAHVELLARFRRR